MNRLLGVLLLVLCTPAPASDLARENRWAAEIADSIMTGDVEYLDADGHRFLALYTPAASDPAKGAVIVVHGSGVHPNWPDVVYPLRTGLAEHGWATLSLQMPVLAADASGKDYFPVLDEVPPRMEAALAFLREQGFEHAIVVAHSLGSLMSTYWLSHAQPSAVSAFAGIGMTDASNGADESVVAYLKKIRTPVLDLYGEHDLPGVMAQAADRAAATGVAGGTLTQVQTPGANHFYQGKEAELVQTLLQWLEELPR